MVGDTRWRTGRKVGRTLYLQLGDEPSDTDPIIGLMDSPDLAETAVRAVNIVPTWLDGHSCDEQEQEMDELRAENERLRAHVLDICAHATPFGDIPDDPGWVGTYLLTAGALHRALGTIGHTAPSCEAEAQRDEAEAALGELVEMYERMHDRVVGLSDVRPWPDAWRRARRVRDRARERGEER